MDVIKANKQAHCSIDPSRPFTSANEGQYLQAIKNMLLAEYSSPSRESISFLAGRLFSGTATQPTLDRFAPIVKEAFRQFVDDRLSERLQPVKSGDAGDVNEALYSPVSGFGTSVRSKIIVSDEEFEKFFVVDIT